jgi:Ca-activated chloride channel family protein
MRTIFLSFLFIVTCMVLPFQAAADAIMRSEEKAYPKKLLFHRMTKAVVILRGTLAETIVYGEFINEWDRPTGGVYSFPLPGDANATGIWFEWKGAYHEAQLKEAPQVINPGTGEGGFAAILNRYLGGNAVTIKIDSILPGAVQRVQLRYIQKARYDNGLLTYRLPLAMEDIETSPVDHLQLIVQIHNAPKIEGCFSPSHPAGWRIIDSLGTYYTMEYSKEKVYLQNDLVIHYSLKSDEFCNKTFSAMSADSGGFFCSTIFPLASMPTCNKNVVFLIDKSTSMKGFKLEQSCSAIKACIGSLSANDRFAIMAFDNTVHTLVTLNTVSDDAKINACAQLDSLASAGGMSSGSELLLGLNSAISLCSDNGIPNSIVALTDGFSSCTPEQIVNPRHAGIFTVGIGSDLSRERLELISYANGGFATFLSEKDTIASDIVSIFNQIRNPIMQNITIICEGSGAGQLIPQTEKFAFYQGASFFLAGRYENAGTAQFGVQGTGADGNPVSHLFTIPMSGDSLTAQQDFLKHFWAAERIRDLERQCIVYNKYTELRPQAVAFSLAYKVKSKFTSYWPDYDKVVVGTIPGPVTTINETHQTKRPNPCVIAFDHTRRLVSIMFIAREKKDHARIRIFDARGRLIIETTHALIAGKINYAKFVLPKQCPSGMVFVEVSIGQESIVRLLHIIR